MKKSEKIFFVQDLTARLKEAKGIVLVDYQGLTVSQINKLRQKIKEVGANLQVVKNRLLKRALLGAGLKIEGEIKKPTALILSERSETSPLKAVWEFARQFDLPKFKFGFLEGERLEAEKLIQLAQLSSREQLLSQLTTTLAYPGRKLVYNLNFNRQRLVMILNQIKKGGEK